MHDLRSCSYLMLFIKVKKNYLYILIYKKKYKKLFSD